MKKTFIIFVYFFSSVQFTYAQNSIFDYGIGTMTSFNKPIEYLASPPERVPYMVKTARTFRTYISGDFHAVFRLKSFKKSNSDLSLSIPFQFSAYIGFSTNNNIFYDNYMSFNAPIELRYTLGTRTETGIHNNLKMGIYFGAGLAIHSANGIYAQIDPRFSLGIHKQVDDKYFTIAYSHTSPILRKYKTPTDISYKEEEFYPSVDELFYGIHSIHIFLPFKIFNRKK